MPFQEQPSVTRNPHIREIEIIMLRTTDENHPEGPQSMQFRITIDDQYGQPMNHLHGGLIPHLPNGVKQQLLDFMDWIWNKAEEEVTPE